VESWTERGSVEQCLADFAGWHDDVRRIIGALEQPYRWALRGRKAMAAWSRGGAVLLGDACHPTLPFLGQGAGMAIEDGALLARCLAKYAPDLATAFARYEGERIPRTTRIVEQSAAMLDVFQGRHLENAQAAQAYVAREWAPDKVRDRYDWLYTYDPYAVSI
jgi:salicylate hydroxylase